MNTMLQDFRYTLRQLRKSPGFTATAVISLALGIGATTAVFSVIYAILMNPYAYAHSDRMVHMRLKDPSGQERFFGQTMGQWQEIRKSPVVEDAFLEDGWNLTITGQELPEDVSACLMSSNSFEFLGVPTALSHIWQIVFSSMAVSVGSGIPAGVLLTIALNRVLARWAEGSARDPLLLLAVTVLLALVAALACAGPARRASAVDPMTALRFE